jgi:hypothetical protein
MINAVEEFSFSLMIIIQRQDLMISWFNDDDDDKLSEDTYVMLSESEFVSNKIVLKFLKHYIKHSDADSNAEWKLMLMNNHENHIILEFITFANENHIQSFSLIFHLTHCMQSLNVEIFQFYKYWHDQIIQNAVVTSFVKYLIEQFLHDLTKIKNHKFKSSIIQHVFKKFEMWSVSENVKILKTVTVWIQVYTYRSANWSMILQSSLLSFYITPISWRFESHQVILWSHFFYHRDHIVWLTSLSSIDFSSSIDSVNFREDHVILVIFELSYSRIVNDSLNLIRRTR